MTGRRSRAQVDAALDALYATLPNIECRGKCHDSCGPIAMSSAERRRLAEQGVRISVTVGAHGLRCTALTLLNRCGCYGLRPAICRIWGLTRALQCSYGCVPDGGWLTEVQAYEFLAKVADLSGETAQAERFRRVAGMDDLERRVWQIRRGDIEEDLARSRAQNRRRADYE